MSYSGKLGLSKTLTSSGIISTAGKAARIWAITLRSGTVAGSIIINDGGSGGTARWSLTTAATTSAGDAVASISFPAPLICVTDAYGTLAGSGATATILYDESLS